MTITAGEQSLWHEHLAVIRAGLDQGKPDAIQNAKAEIRRLDGEMSALVNRRELIAQNGLDVVNITVAIEQKARRIADIRGILQNLKLIPKESDEGATPEVTSRPAARDPIVLLEEAERKAPGTGLTSDQARAAKEIAWVNEGIARAGKARIGNMEAAGRAQGYHEPEMSGKLAEVHSTRYLPWAGWYHDHDPVTLDICIKVAVHGLSLNALGRKHRMWYYTVRDRLQRGLERYWDRKLLDLYNDKRGK
jgi:hypothetical protein